MNKHSAMKGHVLAKVHPGYLKTNAQNHRWPFSAVAELIDNAYDPDVSADVLKIQKEDKNGKRCLVFQDNGNGMDLNHLIKMLSFGFCEKEKFMDQPNSRTPIGQYGNGFKSGSMRLATDALVFTVHKQSETACVGMLSQTLCQQRHIDSLVFPMMEFTMPSLKRSQADLDMKTALEAILDVSPYISEEELKDELSSLRREKRRSGTKIVLFNLTRGDNGETELDFESDPVDIRNPGDVENQLDSGQQPKTYGYRQSLRRYCSILFRNVKMTIQINGKEVERFYFLGDLKEKKDTYYRPQRKDLKGKNVDITFGKEKTTGSGKLEDHGVMFYHRNRLIMPYVELPCQKKGVGLDVVGIVDVTDVLKPIHYKQAFEVNTLEYRSLINALSKKLEKYCEKEDLDEGEEDDKEPEDSGEPKNWVQCHLCQKWRRLPKDFTKPLPRKWFCMLNTDLSRNRCDIDEEDHSQELDMPGPICKAKRKSTSEKPTPTKRARASSATPQIKVEQKSEPSTSSDAKSSEAAPPLKTRTSMEHAEMPQVPNPQFEGQKPAQDVKPDLGTLPPAVMSTQRRSLTDGVLNLSKKTAVLIPVQAQNSQGAQDPATWSAATKVRIAVPPSDPASGHGPPPPTAPAAAYTTSAPAPGNLIITELRRKALRDVAIEGLLTRTTTHVPSGPRPQSSATPSSTSLAPSCRPPVQAKVEPAPHDGSRAAPDGVPREQQGSFQRNVQRLLNYLQAIKMVPAQNPGNVVEVEQNIRRTLVFLGLKFE